MEALMAILMVIITSGSVEPDLIEDMLSFKVKEGVEQPTTQDYMSMRQNTLMDDADDIQQQLDYELRKRVRNGKEKSVWVLHFPNMKGSRAELARRRKDLVEDELNNYDEVFGASWTYENASDWYKEWPNCKGASQSPVNIPHKSMVMVHAVRPLTFVNYDAVPHALTVFNDGTKLVLRGKWLNHRRPSVWGGVGYGRRYLFHSAALHWFAEHQIGAFTYPAEIQAIHISAEYPDMDAALNGNDPQALMIISHIYDYGNSTHEGLLKLLAVASPASGNGSVPVAPLASFCPPVGSGYAAYQGSLSTPPCDEVALWLVSAKPLPMEKEKSDMLQRIAGMNGPIKLNNRPPQPLSDRPVYFFH